MGLHMEKSTLSLYISWLESVSDSGRHLFFNRFFLHLSSLSFSAPKSFSVFLMLVVELLRCMSGLVWVGWRTMVQKEKRKKPSVLINLAKWSEHFLRETMLHVGKIEAGARPFMLTARCKWMQTHLPKNSHASKNEFGSKVLRQYQTWQSFICRLPCRQWWC